MTPNQIEADKPGILSFSDQNISLANLGDNRFILIYGSTDQDFSCASDQAIKFAEIFKSTFPGSRVFVIVASPNEATFVPLRESDSLRDLLRSMVRELVNEVSLGDHR